MTTAMITPHPTVIHFPAKVKHSATSAMIVTKKPSLTRTAQVFARSIAGNAIANIATTHPHTMTTENIRENGTPGNL